MKRFLAIYFVFALHFISASELLSLEIKTQLLKKFDDWEVPVPKKEQALIKLWAYGSDNKDWYFLAFDNKPKKTCLVGFDIESTDPDDLAKVIQLPKEKTPTLSDVAFESPFLGQTFEYNMGIITGLQLVKTGREKLGWDLVQKSIPQEIGHSFNPIRFDGKDDALLVFAKSCLIARLNEIGTKSPDFKKIYRQVNTILEDEPRLKNEYTTWVLTTLKSSTEYSPPKKGSIDRVIHDYLMSGHLSLKDKNHDEAKEKLIELGFTAIPHVFKQLDHSRFTNHSSSWNNNSPGSLATSDGLLSYYLNDFFNLNFEATAESKRESFKKAWKQAQQIGEEKYVTEYTVRSIQKKHGYEERLSQNLIILAQKKYPHTLPSFYKKVIKTRLYCGDIVKAISDSEHFSDSFQFDLFFEGAQVEPKDYITKCHRDNALEALAKIDRMVYNKKLLKLLETCSTESEKDIWSEDESFPIGLLVNLTDSVEIWEKYISLIKRSEFALQVFYIDDIELSDGKNIQKELIKLFSHFKKDHRRESAHYAGPGSTLDLPNIRMCDFIHLKYNRLYKLKVDSPTNQWTRNDWESFNKKVEVKIQQLEKEIL